MTEFLESKKDEENRKIIHTYALVKVRKIKNFLIKIKNLSE